MANIPQKSKDATEEALSAVQDALNVRPPETPPVASTTESETASPPDSQNAELFPQETPVGWPVGEAGPRRAANDDRAGIGQILQTLRHPPARGPYMAAGIAGFIWVAGGLALALMYAGEMRSMAATPGIGLVAAIALAALIAVPVVFFFVLAHMFNRAQDMRVVAESMAEVAMRLAQPETIAHESMVTVGQAIRREVAAMGDGVERALARAAELEALVHNEVSALERAYNDNEVRIRDLLTELTNQRETLVNQAEHVRNAIASVHLDLAHDITSVGDLVADKVNEVAQRVTRSLTEKGEHITLALGHAGDSMIDALSERGSSLLDKLETTSDRTTTAISSASERLSASLNFKTEHVHDEFAALAARLQQMMSARLDQVAQGFAQKSSVTIDSMTARSQQFTDALTETSARLAESIATRADEVNSTLRSTGDSLVLDLSLRGGDVVSKLEQTGARITDTINDRSAAVADKFRESAESLVTALNSRGDVLKDIMAKRLQAFESMFDQSGAEITEKISRDSTNLGNLITRHITEFDHTVKNYGGELVGRLGQRTQDVAEALRNYIDTFDQRVTGRTGEISSTLEQRLAQFEGIMGTRVSELAKTLTEGGKDVVSALDQRIGEVAGTINLRGAEVADAITAKIGEVDQTLGARAIEVANNLDSRIGRFEELLVGRAETVTSQIETRSKAAADALNARLEQLSQAIKANSADAERSLGQLAISTSEAIRSSATDAERTLVGVSEEVARSFVGKADEIAKSVSRRANEMTTVLSEKSGGVLAALAEKGEQFARGITSATDDAVKAIEERGFAFTRTMMDNSTEMSRMINAAGEAATSTVSRTLKDLNDVSQKAIVHSRETATSSVKEMQETHTMLRSDATAMFERLREANIMLQEVLSGAHENMGALENTLMMRVSEFVSSMHEITSSTGDATGRVEKNISNFRDLTAQVINDLGQLARQFDIHGRELANAVEIIEHSNQRTEDRLNERRVQLDSLVSTLDIRTEDLEKRLSRFSGLLDESLEAASGRAREVARVVSEASAEGTRAICEQYERVRENAEEERQRSSETMRALYEQTAGDTEALFRNANERFAEAVQGMKQMAAEMQRELESTRGELRRGVFELPQETAESAAQMRRVIVDQIEALAELNRIVARHGRNLDAIEPVRRVREEPTLAVVGGRNEVTARNDIPRSESPSRSETPSRSEGPSRNEGPSRPAQRTDASGFAPRRTNETSPLGPTPIPPGRGWLTDLLNRASREEAGSQREMRESSRDGLREPGSLRGNDERIPRHTIESLDSLSVDIARMIDHDAAADLWDRYKRGERNVFTRRLYTLQGQQAFDDIRKKYRSDREFKQTVDRYISEFERLLDEVSRDDRGQVVARTYLTSETGKVYTMLAHAAGRFD
jgi:Apolipoprotein A1/A4/E domain